MPCFIINSCALIPVIEYNEADCVEILLTAKRVANCQLTPPNWAKPLRRITCMLLSLVKSVINMIANIITAAVQDRT